MFLNNLIFDKMPLQPPKAYASLFSVLLFMFTVIQSQNLPDFSLSYVSSSSQQYSLAAGSQAGGQTLYIRGYNFPQSSADISVLLGPYSCLVVSSSSILITCLTTPAFTKSSLSLNVTVYGVRSLVCSANSCKYSYSGGNTAVVQQIYQRDSFMGEVISFVGSSPVKSAGDGLNPYSTGYKSLLVGDRQCIFYNVSQLDQSLISWSIFGCQMDPNASIGEYNFSLTTIYGRANISTNVYFVSLFTSSIYNVRVSAIVKMPADVNRGGLYGHIVNLTAASVPTDLSLYTCQLGPYPCSAKKVTSTQLTIQIGPLNETAPSLALQKDSQDNSAQQEGYLGNYGFRYTRYKLITSDINTAAGLMRSNNSQLVIIEEKVIRQLNTGPVYYYSYMEFIRGYMFLGSGSYDFELSCDDGCIVYQSTVANTTSKQHLQRLVQHPYHSSGFNPYVRFQVINHASFNSTQAGYYYTEIFTINVGGVGFYSLNIIAPPFSQLASQLPFIKPNATIAQSGLRSPAYQIVTYNITPIARPEIIEVLAIKSRMGSSANFTLKYGSSAAGYVSSAAITAGDSADTFKSKISNINNLSYYNPVVTLQMQTADMVNTTNASNAEYYRYTLVFQKARLLPIANVLPSTVPATCCSVTRTQNHSAALAGTYRILLNGTTPLNISNNFNNYNIRDIPTSTSPSLIANAFNQYYSASDIKVDQVFGTQLVDSVVFTIFFLGVQNPLPIQIDASGAVIQIDASGAVAEGQMITNVKVNREYSADRLSFEGVPLQFLRVPQSRPCLLLSYRNIPIFCRNCYYQAGLAVASKVSSAALANGVLTIALLNDAAVSFNLQDVEVQLNRAVCGNLVGSIQSFSCSMPAKEGLLLAESGAGRPTIHIRQIGYADNSELEPVTIELVVAKVEPCAASPGTLVSIRGQGFPYDLAALRASDFTLLLCQVQIMEFFVVSVNRVSFVAPAEAGDCRNSSFMSFNGRNTAFAFSYYQPEITLQGLSQYTMPPLQPTNFTIFGSGLDANLTFWLFSNNRNHSQLQITSREESCVSAIWPSGFTGVFQIIGYFNNLAIRNSSSMVIQAKISLDEVLPRHGSMGGGYFLQIYGEAFSATADMQVFIGQATLCPIQCSNSTYIRCTVPAMHINSQPGQLLPVELVARGVIRSTCSNNCTFYYDQNLTSFVEINQTKFIASDIVNVTLVNGSFIDPLALFVDGVQYSYTQVNDSLLFQYPALQQGWHRVSIQTKGMLAYPQLLTYTPLNFPNIFSALTNVSIAGKIVNMTGNGMQTSTTRNLAKIYLKCGGKIQQQERIRTLGNITEVILSGNSPQTCTLNYSRSQSTYKSYSVSYRLSATPGIQLYSNQITNYQLAFRKVNLSSAVYQLAFLVLLDSQGNQGPAKYYMSVANNAINVTLNAASAYLPAGGYRLYAHTSAFGFAVVTNSQNTLFCNFSGDITASAVVTGVAGGNILTLTGKGFITEDPNQNEIYVCGRRAKVLSADQTQLILTLPSLISPAFYHSNGIGEVQRLFGTWFSDNNIAIEYISDGNIKSNYYSSNAQCFIGLDLGSSFLSLIKKIEFIPNVQWSMPASMLVGAVFEASNDSIAWQTIYELPTPLIHSYVNYWLNENETAIYRYFRFRHNASSMCQLAQLALYGIHFYYNADDAQSHSCNISIKSYNQTINLQNKANYRLNSTSIVIKLWPQYGPVNTPTLLTITGSNFMAPVRVIIANIQCQVTNVSNTQILCLTGLFTLKKMGNAFEVFSAGVKSILKSRPFLYVRLWSDFSTWNGYSPPIDGQNVTVGPDINLLIDRNTSKLSQLNIINSTIIVADAANLLIRAQCLSLANGAFLIGSESQAYSHKLQIQLSGQDGTQSYFKCVNCEFKAFGLSSATAWTELGQNVQIGSTKLVLSRAVDWTKGDTIVIASSSYDKAQAEIATIYSITNNGTQIQVMAPFRYFHQGGLQNFGNLTANFRAEVGRLTRNIVFSNGISRNGYHLTFAGSKTKGLRFKLSSIELKQCGVPQLGKSCINIDNAGQIEGNYLRELSIHDTLSRMITLSSSDYLQISRCFGYNIHGNGISLQDGSETNNKILDNLIINTNDAYGIPLMDATSAAFYLSHPYNRVEGNRAAGGGFYGFLLSFPPTSTGKLSVPDICPQGSPMLKFSNNTAHSFNNFGFRIYLFSARQFACLSTLNESSLNPFLNNPSIQSELSVLIAYRNKVTGVLAQTLGNTLLTGLILADNIQSNLQIHKTNLTQQPVIVSESLIIGISQFGDGVKTSESIGVVTARTEGLILQGITFSNFVGNMSMVQSCSQCQNKLYAIVGGITTTFGRISILNVSSSFITWNSASRDIFYDRDASLSSALLKQFNATANSTYLTPYLSSLLDPSSCFNVSGSEWNGSLLCLDNAVRAVQFQNVQPMKNFVSVKAKLYLLHSPYQNVSTYNLFSFGQEQQSGAYTYNTWAIRFLVNRYYNVHWGNDFLAANVLASTSLTQNEAIVIRFNITIPRQFFYVGKFYKLRLFYPTLRSQNLINPLSCRNGEHFYDVQTQYLFLCVSGRSRQIREMVNLNTSDCLNLCPHMISKGMEYFPRYWSDEKQWPGGRLPQRNGKVTIPYQWNMVMDVDPPELQYLQVNGNLIFDRRRNNTLTAHVIWVNRGKIWIGSSKAPFLNTANILLKGSDSEQPLELISDFKSRKTLLVTGGLQFFGVQRSKDWTPLLASASAGTNKLSLEVSPDWSVGDEIVISCSFANGNETQSNSIAHMTDSSLTLQRPLLFDHYGSLNAPIANTFGQMDTRSVVAVLSRNIQIEGDSSTSLGGSIVVTSALLQSVNSPILKNVVQNGYANLVNVEISNLGDISGISAVNLVRLSTYAPNNKASLISHSVIHNCSYSCLDITSSTNLTISNNLFAFSDVYMAYVKITDNFVFSSNLMLGLLGSYLTQALSMYYHASDVLDGENIKITNNFAAGTAATAYVLPLAPCGSSTITIANNFASSAKTGLFLQGNINAKCLVHTTSKLFACQLGIFVNAYDRNDQITLSQLMMSDNHLHIKLSFSKTSFENRFVIRDSFFSNYQLTDCANCYSLSFGKLYQCAKGYLIDVQYTENPTLNISQLTYQKLKQYYPSYAQVLLLSNIISNYFSSPDAAPICSNSSIFRWEGQSFANYPQINLVNTSCLSCSSSVWFSLQAYLPVSQNIEGFVADYDGVLTGRPQVLMPYNYWTKSARCQLISASLYACPLNLYVTLKLQSIAPDYLNRIITPVALQDLSQNYTVYPRLHQVYLLDQRTSFTYNRFASPLERNHSYSLSYGDSPPIDSFYQLKSASSALSWLRIVLAFGPTNFVSVFVSNSSGTDILVKPWLLIDGQTNDFLSQVSQCGSNIFNSDTGVIQFILNNIGDCRVRIVSLSYFKLQSIVKLNSANLTAEQISQIVNKIAITLGVSAERVQITQLKASEVGLVVTSYLQAFVSSNVSKLGDSHEGTNHRAQKQELNQMQQSLSMAIESKSALLQDFQNTTYSYKIVVINSSSAQQEQNATAEQEEIMALTEKKANNLFEVVMGVTVTITLIIWCLSLCRSRQPVRNFRHPPDEEQEIVNQLPHCFEGQTTKKRKL